MDEAWSAERQMAIGLFVLNPFNSFSLAAQGFRAFKAQARSFEACRRFGAVPNFKVWQTSQFSAEEVSEAARGVTNYGKTTIT